MVFSCKLVARIVHMNQYNVKVLETPFMTIYIN